MRIRVSDYFEQFRCLAGECPHTCCAKWEVVIDEDTALRYQQVAGDLGEKLRAELHRDEDGDFCFALRGGRCPFLEEDDLCQIHKQLGEEATSVTCREHPRFIEDYGPFREITLSASCPEANRLLLASRDVLTFREWEDGEAAEEGDEWLDWLLPLRQRMLAMLADRTRPLNARLGDLLTFGRAVQLCLEDEGNVPALVENWTAEPRRQAAGAGLFPEALAALAQLEILEADWLQMLAAAAEEREPVEEEERLERIAAYFLFRYLLKSVNDGDLLGRVELCVLSVLAVEKLAAVCGLEEALRRFSCEIEHSDANLDTLLEWFWQSETFTFERFENELSVQ